MVTEKGPVAVDGLPHYRILGGIVIELIVDSHGQSIYPYYPVTNLYFVQFEVDVQYPLYGTDKVTHIVVGMESDKVRPQQSFQYFGTFRKDTEKFVRRKGDVMEIADTEFRIYFS